MSIPPSEPQIPSEHSTPSEVLTSPSESSEHSIPLLTELPLLVLRGILDHIHQPSDLCSVCLVSRDLYNLAVPLLYTNLKFYAKYDRFGPRLLDGLLLPKHSQRWGKWVRSFEVCGTPSGTPGGGTLTTGESHTICMVLALVLGKIEVGRLRKFGWSCTTSLRPHEIVIDALLKHKTIQSLEVNLAGGWEWHTQLIAGITDYWKHITDLRLWKISSEEQMGEIAKALKHMDLKCLGLTISDLVSWGDDTPHWGVLPQLKGNTSQLVWIRLSGFDLTDDPEKFLGTFFNPSTLRQLSLRNYGNSTELSRLLSPHLDTANLEVLKLEYHCSEPQSVELLIRILDKCRNLRVIALSSNYFTGEKLKLLMQAITKSKETLETVALSLTDHDNGSVIFEKETMIPFKSFVRLQELGIDIDVDINYGLAYLASVLPRTIRIIDIRCLSSELMVMYYGLHDDRFPEPTLERFATSFYEIHDGLACPELIVFGDIDNYLDLRFFVVNPLDPDWTFQQYMYNRERVVDVSKVDQEDARILAGDSELFDFRY